MQNKGENTLVREIAAERVAPGRLTAWWLGGSGFALKNAEDKVLYIDPYLSNSVEAIFGLARAFPSPIEPDEAAPDLVIATHWHEDHLDPGTIPVIAQNCSETHFVMPPSAASHAVSWGVPPGRIAQLSGGAAFERHGFHISHVPARHEAGIPGWETPDAMGVLISVEGVRFYHTGDTEHDARLRNLRSQKIDVVTACINGVTGNMDAHEAALLAWQLGARVVIPHHHLLWAVDTSEGQATLDPRLFAETYRKLGGQGQVVLSEVGVPIHL